MRFDVRGLTNGECWARKEAGPMHQCAECSIHSCRITRDGNTEADIAATQQAHGLFSRRTDCSAGAWPRRELFLLFLLLAHMKGSLTRQLIHDVSNRNQSQ